MEKGLAVSMTQPMIQSAMESLDGMREFAKVILNSGIAPYHLYEKGPDGKPDFKKGNVEKLMGIFIKGDQLKMHPMTAMQEVVPVNGLLSIKGDGAKSLILNSGKIKKGSWKESEEGSVDDGTYKITITATREDTEETLSRSFSVAQAKRAGLWITQEMLQKADGWKKKQSAWYKFPERMCKYRALGFLARDLFTDVLSGTYTLEEAQDYVDDVSTEITTQRGSTVIIPDQQFSKDRSERITGNAAAMVDEFNDKPTEEVSAPVTEVHTPPVQTSEGGPEEELPAPFHWTEQALTDAKSDELLKACMEVGSTKDAVEIIPGKNTNKKLRIIILAYQKKQLDALVRSYSGEQKEEGPAQEATPAQQEEIPPTAPEQPENDPDDGMEPIERHDEGEVEPNLEFERSETKVAETPKEQPPAVEKEGSIPEDTNKFGIEIPGLSENDDRPFEVIKDMFFDFQTKAKLSNQMFDEMNAKMLNGKYKNMEEFCKVAPVGEINLLLNSVK